MPEANYIYNPNINTNYVDLEIKRDIIKKTIKTPIKSLFTTNTVNLWIKNQKENGRIYDKESLKLAIFVKKYSKINSFPFQNRFKIFEKCLYSEYSWAQRANQIIENNIVKQNPDKYGFERKYLRSDNYYNLILIL